MRHAATALVLSVCSIATGQGLSPALNPQPPPSSQSPSFEVATIKPNRSDSNRVNLNLQPGSRFVATNVSLQVLISVAYGDPRPLPPNRMVMNAPWIAGNGGYAAAERFDIEAKADGDLAQDQLPSALQKLLADRFQLLVHHESR